MFAVPAVYVVVQVISLDAPFAETWDEIRGPLWRTLQLATLVSATTAFIGTLLAWVTVRTDLPFRRAWRVALVLPLVLPSFVGAGAFIAGIAPGGIIHDVAPSDRHHPTAPISRARARAGSSSPRSPTRT